jgi:hypothetical protein
MVRDHEWLFVGGIARSGTTLMSRLLTLHPEAFVTAECGWPLNIYWGLTLPPGYTMATWRHGPSGKTYRASWTLPRLKQYEGAAAEVVRAMCEGYVERLHPEVRVAGDKWPMLGAMHPTIPGRRVWEDLRLIMPECKILFMDRALEAAAASAVRVWPTQATTATYRRQATERLEGQRECTDAFWVRLEALNADPREVMEGVLEFADLPAATYPWEEFDVYFEQGHRVN